jgi:pilus assembly protein Flp/PilA
MEPLTVAGIWTIFIQNLALEAIPMLNTISHSERAQGLVEYGLIIALVAVVAIAGLIVFGPAVSDLLSKLGGSV